jgi:hypothetical protein
LYLTGIGFPLAASSSLHKLMYLRQQSAIRFPSRYVTRDGEEGKFLYVVLADAKYFIKHVISAGNKRSTAALGKKEASMRWDLWTTMSKERKAERKQLGLLQHTYVYLSIFKVE